MPQPHPEAAVTENSVQKQPETGKLSADRIKELQQEEEVRQMLFIAEQYLGTTLSRTVTDEFLYIYDQLHFSVDLIDYLIEYCVSKGSKDIHYIKKVAFNRPLAVKILINFHAWPGKYWFFFPISIYLKY